MTWANPFGTRIGVVTCPKTSKDNVGKPGTPSRNRPTIENIETAGASRIYGTRGQVLSKESVDRKKRVIARIYARVSTYTAYIGEIFDDVPPHVRKPSRTGAGQSRKTTRRHRLQVHEPRSGRSARPASPTPELSCSVRRIESAWTKTASLAGAQVRADQTTGTPGTHRGPSLTNRGGAR